MKGPGGKMDGFVSKGQLSIRVEYKAVLPI